MRATLSRSGQAYRRLRVGRNVAVVVLKRLRNVHPTASVHPSCHVATDLEAGPYAFLGRACTVAPLVQIGRYTMLASEVAIVGDDHNWADPTTPMQFSGRPPQQRTVIGSDVWLGHRVIVLRGVTIGDGAIVAAGAVVTRDVPPREVWAGVPARKLRDRFTTAAERDRHAAILAGPLLPPRFAEARHTYEEHDVLV